VQSAYGAPAPDLALTIVGVVGDVRQMGLGEDVRPEFFVSCLQPAIRTAPWSTLIVRTTIDPANLATPLKAIAGRVNPEVPFARVQPLDAILANTLTPPRVYTSLLGAFAALALLLAAVGLYGVMSYSVAQRTHEMGIRLALGARRWDVIGLVLRQAFGMTAIGTLIGLTAAFAVVRLITWLVPTAEPSDPLTLAVVSMVLLAAAGAASLAPALRGSRVDPLTAVRHS